MFGRIARVRPLRLALAFVLVFCTAALSACAQAPLGNAGAGRSAGDLSAVWDAEDIPKEGASGGKGVVSSGETSKGEDSAESSDNAQGRKPGGAADPEASFPSWDPASESLAAIVAFVGDVVDEGGANWVPPEDRIAVFDLDGTLISEKAPSSMDYGVLFHRVFDDPSFVGDDEMVQLCTSAKAVIDAGGVDPGLGDAKGALFARAFAGMTPADLRALVDDYLDTHEAGGFSGLKCGDIAFKPMAEVVDFLQANDFEVYIVTGSNRDIARSFAEGRLGIDPDCVIGSEWGLVAPGQGDADSGDYAANQEELVYSGEQLFECLGAEKVTRIQSEIGKPPIIAFGNSSGDFAVLDYAQTNGVYPGMSVLVVDDDFEREYGDADHAAAMAAAIAEQGWTGISMRDDWATIFGPGVEKTGFAAS